MLHKYCLTLLNFVFGLTVERYKQYLMSSVQETHFEFHLLNVSGTGRVVLCQRGDVILNGLIKRTTENYHRRSATKTVYSLSDLRQLDF